MVSDLGLEDFVFFHNFIPLQEMPELMSNADVGIASLCGYDEYTQEGLTIKLFEYLAMGLPAIGTTTNATKYYLGEESALLSKPNDYKDVARCIKELYWNPEKRHQLIKNGLDYIKRNNWESQMGIFLRIVDKLVYPKH